MKTYCIFKFNSEYNLRADNPVTPYTKVAVYNGRTAHDALRRFAAANGIGPIVDGPAAAAQQRAYWLDGRKRLSSWGHGQYHADVTTLPANIAEAL